jgi:hypothetical protein
LSLLPCEGIISDSRRCENQRRSVLEGECMYYRSQPIKPDINEEAICNIPHARSVQRIHSSNAV